MINQIRPSSTISVAERKEIIEEYLKGGKSKAEIWRQYTGMNEEHGQLNRWMRKLGYLEDRLPGKGLSLPIMPSKNNSQATVEQLQKQIRELEKRLQDSQLKEEAYRRMIEIAEKELKISIRKKPNTK
jgi:transposase-like protein